MQAKVKEERKNIENTTFNNQHITFKKNETASLKELFGKLTYDAILFTVKKFFL